MPVLDVQALIDDRVEAIREYHEKTGIKRAQLDVSGGVDSAVMLGLLAIALGEHNITAVYSGIESSDSSRLRAQDAAATFDVPLIKLELTVEFQDLVDTLVRGAITAGFSATAITNRMADDPTVLGSIRSCIRAPIGRGLNRLTGGGIRHGTGNECEDKWLRFYQKGGDGEVDTNPLAMLSKGEVYQLAVALGVPESILSATPSPDLQAVGESGHNDEDELRELYGVDFTYSKVDREGNYTEVGTIEMVSRAIDLIPPLRWEMLTPKLLSDYLIPVNPYIPSCFPGLSMEEASDLLLAAQPIDMATRHKENPNCPALGRRDDMVEAGILSNKLGGLC